MSTVPGPHVEPEVFAPQAAHAIPQKTNKVRSVLFILVAVANVGPTYSSPIVFQKSRLVAPRPTRRHSAIAEISTVPIPSKLS
jgi:hypothetical protein